MIYTWECQSCKKITETEQPVRHYDIPPKACQYCNSAYLKRVIVAPPSVPFQTLRDSGVFADSNGNFAPRSI